MSKKKSSVGGAMKFFFFLTLLSAGVAGYDIVEMISDTIAIRNPYQPPVHEEFKWLMGIATAVFAGSLYRWLFMKEGKNGQT